MTTPTSADDFRNDEDLRAAMTHARNAIAPHFSAETAAPGWEGGPPSAGHCAVVAALLRQHFGGEMVSATVDGGSHWFSRFAAGGVSYDVDLTGDQFGRDPVQIGSAGSLYGGTRVRVREDLNEATRARVELLASRVGRLRPMPKVVSLPSIHIAREDLATIVGEIRGAVLMARGGLDTDVPVSLRVLYHILKKGSLVADDELLAGDMDRTAPTAGSPRIVTLPNFYIDGEDFETIVGEIRAAILVARGALDTGVPMSLQVLYHVLKKRLVNDDALLAGGALETVTPARKGARAR